MRQLFFTPFLTLSLIAPIVAQSPLYRDPSLSGPMTASQPQSVQFLSPQQIAIAAGRPVAVTLRFRIAPDFHINSHTPRDKFLIPTEVSLPQGAVKLKSARYPSGEAYTLPADPATRLDVYTGDFSVEVSLLAPAGEHVIDAKLRYQACDRAQCLPPKTLIVPLDVLAK